MIGASGNPENLYWSHNTSGWRFAIGAFSYIDNGSGNVGIRFTNNGALGVTMAIHVIKLSILNIV